MRKLLPYYGKNYSDFRRLRHADANGHFEIVTSCMTCSQCAYICIEQLEDQLFIVKILIRLGATFSGFAIFALSRICVSWFCLNDFKYSWLGWVLLPSRFEIF